MYRWCNRKLLSVIQCSQKSACQEGESFQTLKDRFPFHLLVCGKGVDGNYLHYLPSSELVTSSVQPSLPHLLCLNNSFKGLLLFFTVWNSLDGVRERTGECPFFWDLVPTSEILR